MNLALRWAKSSLAWLMHTWIWTEQSDKIWSAVLEILEGLIGDPDKDPASEGRSYIIRTYFLKAQSMDN